MDLGIFKQRKNNELQSLCNKPNIWHFLSSIERVRLLWQPEGCHIRKALIRNPSEKRPIQDHAKDKWIW